MPRKNKNAAPRPKVPKLPGGRRPSRRPGRPKRPGSTVTRLVELTLHTRHNINGTPYGPGVVQVIEPLAAMLREQEQRVRDEDARFHGQRAVLVGPGLRVHEVPYETFDEHLAAALPFQRLGK